MFNKECLCLTFRIRVEGELGVEERARIDDYLQQHSGDLVVSKFVEYVNTQIAETHAVPAKRRNSSRHQAGVVSAPSLPTVTSLMRWRCDVYSLAEGRDVVQHEPTAGPAKVNDGVRVLVYHVAFMIA